MTLLKEHSDHDQISKPVPAGTPIDIELEPGQVLREEEFTVNGTMLEILSLPRNLRFLLIRINHRHAPRRTIFAGRAYGGTIIRKLYITTPTFSNQGGTISIDVAIVAEGGGLIGGAPNLYPPNGTFNRRPDADILVPTDTIYVKQNNTSDFTGTGGGSSNVNLGSLSSANTHTFLHRAEMWLDILLDPLGAGDVKFRFYPRETSTLEILGDLGLAKLFRSPPPATDGVSLHFVYEPATPLEWFRPNDVEFRLEVAGSSYDFTGATAVEMSQALIT